jgi:hypothetical protein
MDYDEPREGAHERQDTALPSAFLAVAVLLAVAAAVHGYEMTFAVLCAVAALSFGEWRSAREFNKEHGTD